MSDDLIRRSDAIEAIEVVDWYHQNRNKDMVGGANSDEHQAWYKAEDVYKALETVPSADRPQGEWFKDDEGTFICSACGSGYKDQPTIMGKPMFEWCPICGARMFAKDINVPDKKGADDE